MTEGRIVKGVGGLYVVAVRGGFVFCRPRGILRKQRVSPVVGDIALITEGKDGETGSIESVLERKNELLRPRVANVDLVAVVCAADTVNLFSLDRYLVILEEQTTTGPFEICLLINKRDLADETYIGHMRDIYETAGYRVITTDTVTKGGTDALVSLFRGKTTVLAGESGAGKSSIINALCDNYVMAVGELSKKIPRGKHTTRHAEMFMTDTDSFVADTPGFASVTITATRDAIARCFREFAPHTDACRFADCRHIHEPGCSVREHMEAGISRTRYEHYVSFYTEAGK